MNSFHKIELLLVAVASEDRVPKKQKNHMSLKLSFKLLNSLTNSDHDEWNNEGGDCEDEIVGIEIIHEIAFVSIFLVYLIIVPFE